MAEPKSPADQMRAVLQAEREAIRSGDFAALETLVRCKTDLLARLEGESGTALSALRDAAQQNGRMLAAALEGVRAAQRRLSLIREAVRGFQSYDSTGRAQRISREGGSGLEHRA
ncbi:hypothetical protein O5O51_00825 [Sinirhodobacter sp. HNIBRBA609]|nr:hypothetical protein O5O51_00825 [Sinirhodobacter sp. HNIBRBA609]